MSANPLNKRFAYVAEGYQDIIRDVEHGLNFLFVAEGGMGVPTPQRKLAQKVVDFLNSLPPEDTLLYPYNRK